MVCARFYQFHVVLVSLRTKLLHPLEGRNNRWHTLSRCCLVDFLDYLPHRWNHIRCWNHIGHHHHLQQVGVGGWDLCNQWLDRVAAGKNELSPEPRIQMLSEVTTMSIFSLKFDVSSEVGRKLTLIRQVLPCRRAVSHRSSWITVTDGGVRVSSHKSRRKELVSMIILIEAQWCCKPWLLDYVTTMSRPLNPSCSPELVCISNKDGIITGS